MGGRRPDLVRTYVPRVRAKWNVTFRHTLSRMLWCVPVRHPLNCAGLCDLPKVGRVSECPKNPTFCSFPRPSGGLLLLRRLPPFDVAPSPFVPPHIYLYSPVDCQFCARGVLLSAALCARHLVDAARRFNSSVGWGRWVWVAGARSYRRRVAHGRSGRRRGAAVVWRVSRSWMCRSRAKEGCNALMSP